MTDSSRSVADEVLELLRAHGFQQEAADLEQQLLKLRTGTPHDRVAAQAAIQQRCHPRWLGDLFLPGVALKTWWDLLEQLARTAAKEAD